MHARGGPPNTSQPRTGTPNLQPLNGNSLFSRFGGPSSTTIGGATPLNQPHYWPSVPMGGPVANSGMGFVSGWGSGYQSLPQFTNQHAYAHTRQPMTHQQAMAAGVKTLFITTNSPIALTRQAVKAALEGVEGVERIACKHRVRNGRSFAFVRFSSHHSALHALQAINRINDGGCQLLFATWAHNELRSSTKPDEDTSSTSSGSTSSSSSSGSTSTSSSSSSASTPRTKPSKSPPILDQVLKEEEQMIRTMSLEEGSVKDNVKTLIEEIDYDYEPHIEISQHDHATEMLEEELRSARARIASLEAKVERQRARISEYKAQAERAESRLRSAPCPCCGGRHPPRRFDFDDYLRRLEELSGSSHLHRHTHAWKSLWDAHVKAREAFCAQPVDPLGYQDVPWPDYAQANDLLVVYLQDMMRKSESERKRALHQLALVWHPDKFLQRIANFVENDRTRIIDRVNALFKLISEAMNVDRKS